MKRVQRKRTKGWKMPENTVYVGRPTMFGNPFKVVKYERGTYGVEVPGTYLNKILDEYSPLPFMNKNEAISCATDCYRIMAKKDKWLMDKIKELKGKDLACWCSLSSPCHADVLIELLT